MLKTDRLVIVEGKYDKIKLEGIIDALIIATDGFSVFKDKQKTEFIKNYAKKKGLLILTDSDAAGFKIRNYFSSIVPDEYILHAYIPDVSGKEKRKEKPSGEGKLGVEGIDDAIITESLKKAGIERSDKKRNNHTSSYDLFALGICGKPDCTAKKLSLLKEMGLPERISNKSLLKYINLNLTKEEFNKIVHKITEE